MSNFIRNGAIATDDWTTVMLPAATDTVVRKQAGKVVLFKLTGESSVSPEQIVNTVIPASGKVIIPLSVWLARKESLAERLASGELGVWLDTHELLETLLDSTPDLNAFQVIAVRFDRFVDGRGYSIGTLLRTRHGFSNELRAFGDVLRDQLYFLKRCGFNAYQIRADRSAEAALASLRDFTEPYQGAVDEQLPVWRRYARHASEHPSVKVHPVEDAED